MCFFCEQNLISETVVVVVVVMHAMWLWAMWNSLLLNCNLGLVFLYISPDLLLTIKWSKHIGADLEFWRRFNCVRQYLATGNRWEKSKCHLPKLSFLTGSWFCLYSPQKWKGTDTLLIFKQHMCTNVWQIDNRTTLAYEGKHKLKIDQLTKERVKTSRSKCMYKHEKFI